MLNTPDRNEPTFVPYPDRLYAWFVVAVLIAASLIAFIDRQVVAIVVEPMKTDLGITNTEVGWLYGVFALFYAMAALPIAAEADRRSRKHIIAIGIFLWSLMTIACGLTRGYWQIFLARIGVGVGEATLSPSTTSLIGDYFPREDIPLALSVFQFGPIAGSGIAFIHRGVGSGHRPERGAAGATGRRHTRALAADVRLRRRARPRVGGLLSGHPRTRTPPIANRLDWTSWQHGRTHCVLTDPCPHTDAASSGLHFPGTGWLRLCFLERDVSGAHTR
jgi:hypothetical protein